MQKTVEENRGIGNPKILGTFGHTIHMQEQDNKTIN